MVAQKSGQENRLAWVDVARGIGIILVVYAHVLRAHLPVAKGTGWAATHDHVIYAFHMPLFFVLSGLFLWNSVGKGRQQFVSSRWWQMIWPYLFWSAITAAIEMVMSRFVNSPMTWHEVMMIPLQPIEQYWFLYALLIHQLVIAALWPRKWLLIPVVLAGLALLQWLGGAWIQIRAFDYLPYTVGGVLAATSLFGLASRSTWMQTMVAAICGILFVALYQVYPPTNPTFLSRFLLGFLGSLGTMSAAMLLARTPLADGLAQLGAASLAIYLVHTIFSAGARIALKLVGISPADPISLLVATLAGLVGPWVIWRWAVSRGETRILGFGGGARPARAP
jgi:fucose 4-O-acetylase-like acetyltransferase